MKKILIPILSLLVLPLAMPSSATFYSEDTPEPGKQKQTGSEALLANINLHSLSVQKRIAEHRDQSSRQLQARLKEARKTARNSAYGRPDPNGSSAGSKGGSKGGSTSGPTSYDKGSTGSKGLSKPKHHRGKAKFKHLGKDFWSKEDFNKAMLCWLAPHLHEDKEFVNRHWNKWSDKWKWMHKYYKHKFHKPRPDKPSEVPVPASAVLFGTALLGLATIGKPRRHTTD